MATVVVDPGHGGSVKVGGSSANNATGPTGLLEKDVTLDVCRRVKRRLAAAGHRVLLTREGDTNLGLRDRAVLARTEAAAAFVSVHFNGWKMPAVQGTETYVHEEAPGCCRRLAEAVQRRVQAATGLRDRGVKRARYGVLSPGYHVPASACCLVEVSFLTNPQEEARLKTEAYREAVAGAIAEAVCEYLESA